MEKIISYAVCHAVEEEIFFDVTVDEPSCRDQEINKSSVFTRHYTIPSK